MTTVTFVMTTFWKRRVLPAFFKGYRIRFAGIRSLKHRLNTGQLSAKPGDDDIVAFWASNEAHCTKLRNLARDLAARGIPVIRIEDAFIRSNGLGCNFFYPYSLALDRSGIYYDPSGPSDLENILTSLRTRSDYQELRTRADRLRRIVIDGGITKYRSGSRINPVHEVATLLRENPGKFDRVIFIPAQVDQDASVVLGGLGYNNLSLIRRVRKDNPRALIIVKIHPDVLSGLRNGFPEKDELKHHVDFLCTDSYSPLDLAEIADEIHTMCSLTGFEALLRGKKVVCYGMPFYAGYGLTEDICALDGNEIAVAARKRRANVITDITDLVIGSLILYPRYFNWDTGCEASAEEVVSVLLNHPEGTRQNRIFRIRNQLYLLFRKCCTLTAGIAGQKRPD